MIHVIYKRRHVYGDKKQNVNNYDIIFKKRRSNVEGNIKNLRKCYIELLDVFDQVCKKNGILWYMWAGTLLGAIRHGGFIPWDDDIDVCMHHSFLNKLIAAKWPKGYSFGPYNPNMYLLCKDGTTMVNCKDKRSRQNVYNGVAGVKIDIFPLFDTPDKSGKGIRMCATLFPKSKKNKRYPLDCFGKPKFAKFEGKFYPIPNDTYTLLGIDYGPDYLIPKKQAGQHLHFIDLNHGQQEYASGALKIPDRKDFKPTDGEVMFAKE